MIKKAKIENKIYDVIGFDEYSSNPDSYKEYTAIEEDSIVFPIRNKTDDRPGVYPGEIVSFFKKPIEEEIYLYDSSNIIDFEQTESLKDIIEQQNKLRTAERSILTTVNNVFEPKIGDNDAPEMIGLKEAVIAKHIDLDKYEQRFGVNFNNDKRLFSKDSITLSKLKTIFDVLDMKATMIIEDKFPDVPNPMGKQIIVELTGGQEDESI